MPYTASQWAASGASGFLISQEGACVVNGQIVRVLIGKLPDGNYGIGL